MDGLDYDFEMRNSSKNKDGHILEKYLSIGKHDVLVFYKDKTCNDGFDCALASVSSIDYGLPQIRQRKYLLAWPRNGIIGKCGNASLIGRNWLELMEFLKSKVPHSVKNYIDEMDDPSVLRWTEALSGQLGIMTKKMKAQSNPKWWATDDKDVSEHNITYNYDVGSKLSGSLFCNAFRVDNNNLDRYWMVLAAKCLCIPFTMLFVRIIPSNADVHKLSDKMNAEK